jgi:protein O-mannosyl-transferase
MLTAEHLKPKPLLMQGLFLCLITLLFCWISLPGLAGGFILDDWPNLGGLEQVKTHIGALQFSLSGVSSQLGRPLSLLTFALQAEHWPHNPFPFKLAGLCIHIANAGLIYGSCYLIALISAWPQRSAWIFASTVFTLWLFHPLNISTVFYVVQRMTLLAAFFSLLGVTAFLWGFRISLAGQTGKGLIIATMGIALTYSLGILSKENAVLTGLGISVLYWLLLRNQKRSLLWDSWIIILGVMPSLIILIYLCFDLNHYTRSGFTPFQRLLTESVILLDYVDKILLPTPNKLNIFNDGFPVYKNVFDSFVTIKAVTLWLTSIALAIAFRQRVPFLAFAVFWFLSGHILESSIFGLELYFEHRNYLPSVGIIIGIAGTLMDINHKALRYSKSIKDGIRYSSIGLLSLMSLGYMLVYGAEVSTWRSPGALAISALTERPHSLRAHQEAAAFFANSGDFSSSSLLAHTIEKKWPNYPGTYSQLVMLQCMDKNVLVPANEAIKQRLQTGRFDRGTLDSWKQIYDFKKAGHCPTLTWDQYREFLDQLLNNASYNSQKEDLVILLALSYNAEEKYSEAATSLDKITENRVSLDFLIFKAKFYAMAGLKQEALQLLERARTQHTKDLKTWLPRKNQVNDLEQQILTSMSRPE